MPIIGPLEYRITSVRRGERRKSITKSFPCAFQSVESQNLSCPEESPATFRSY